MVGNFKMSHLKIFVMKMEFCISSAPRTPQKNEVVRGKIGP